VRKKGACFGNLPCLLCGAGARGEAGMLGSAAEGQKQPGKMGHEARGARAGLAENLIFVNGVNSQTQKEGGAGQRYGRLAKSSTPTSHIECGKYILAK